MPHVAGIAISAGSLATPKRMPWLAERSPKPRISASSRGDDAGDLLDARQRRALLDQRLETDLAFQPKLRLELRQQRVEEPDVARRLRLRHDDDVELVARALDHFDHVVVRPVRVGAVDAHGADLLAPVEIAQRIDGVLARRFLLRRRDRIFEIEEHHVGRRSRIAFSIILGLEAGVESSERRSRSVMICSLCAIADSRVGQHLLGMLAEPRRRARKFPPACPSA